MYPARGTTMETEFNVNCEEDFKDDDLPLTYSVQYQLDISLDKTIVFEGKRMYTIYFTVRNYCIAY